MLIAGDVGGTKTHLAIYSAESGPHAPLAQIEFHGADYPSLQAMVKEFLAQAKISVDVASFDVAAPLGESDQLALDDGLRLHGQRSEPSEPQATVSCGWKISGRGQATGHCHR